MNKNAKENAKRENMKLIAIRIPPEVLKEIDMLSKAYGDNRSMVIRMMVDNYFLN